MASAEERTERDLLQELQAARRRVAELEARLQGNAASNHRGMLETLLANVPDYVYFKDENRRFVAASNLFCDLFGLGLDEILGKTDEELFPPGVAEETSRDDLSVIRTGKPIISKEEGSDELGWVLTTKVPWLDAEGSVIGLVGISRDITQRKQQEKARRRQDEHYRQLVEYSPTVTWLTDATGTTSFISSNVEQVYGYTSAEIQNGGNALWFGRIHPDDRARVREAFEALFSRRAHFDVEYRIQRKDGEWMWLHDRANAVVQEEGELLAYGVFTDISERKRAEQERRDLEARLHQAQRLESLGVMASGLAHDFNNLLLAIGGNVDLARSCLEPDSQAREWLADAKTAALRAGELVSQMLAYAGKGSTRREVLDLRVLVQEMAGLLVTPITNRTKLQLELAPGALVTRGDPTQIRQIVMNLITNAAQAIGEEAGQITVRAEAVECDRALLSELRPDRELPAGTYLRLRVSDDGGGMDDAIRERIFDPFFTTKERGSGLGLSAVHGIVRSHGGAIRVESELGRGSTFTLWLPGLALATVPNAQHRMPSAPAPEKGANGPRH